VVLYRYIKEKNSAKKKVINYFSYITLTIGSVLLFWSFYPILSFEIYSRLFLKKQIFSPMPETDAVSSLEKANSILGSYNVFSNNLKDFTQVNLWFPTKPQNITQENLRVKNYSLSIPKLNIKEAKVIVGGSDLIKSLVQYLPETLPGDYGNVVVFGHSTLPAMYNPSDYKTIFTFLPSLEKGDKIIAKVESVNYEYEVYDMFVVNPDQISVLEQSRDSAYLTLITCVPPGTYWKRLVIKAKLTQLPGD